MRELTISEAEEVAGGLGVLASIAIGVAASLAASYAYEKVGGAKGIEKKVKAALNALAEGAKARSEICQQSPSACMPVG